MRGILASLHYFDLFDHPLTLMEVVRYRYIFGDTGDGRRVLPEDAKVEDTSTSSATETDRTASEEGALLPSPALSEIVSALHASGAQCKNGYWFLPGREAIVATRQRRHRMSEAKFRRARRAARLMSMLPSVRMVAVCNSLALANADRESDIDLFVVARPGTLWSTRLLLVGALALLGMRPGSRSHADKICMSFFVSEDALDLQPFMHRPDDTYLRYWIASLVPLHDAGGIMPRFLAANDWVAERVPGATSPRRAVSVTRVWSLPVDALLRLLDPAARALQRMVFPQRIRNAAPGDIAVVVNDDVLKFHVDDRRGEFERRFRERVASMHVAVEQVKEMV